MQRVREREKVVGGGRKEDGAVFLDIFFSSSSSLSIVAGTQTINDISFFVVRDSFQIGKLFFSYTIFFLLFVCR